MDAENDADAGKDADKARERRVTPKRGAIPSPEEERRSAPVYVPGEPPAGAPAPSSDDPADR